MYEWIWMNESTDRWMDNWMNVTTSKEKTQQQLPPSSSAY